MIRVLILALAACTLWSATPLRAEAPTQVRILPVEVTIRHKGKIIAQTVLRPATIWMKGQNAHRDASFETSSSSERTVACGKDKDVWENLDKDLALYVRPDGVKLQLDLRWKEVFTVHGAEGCKMPSEREMETEIKAQLLLSPGSKGRWEGDHDIEMSARLLKEEQPVPLP